MTTRDYPLPIELDALARQLRADAGRLPNIAPLTVFDLQSLQALADGCAQHPAYRAVHLLDVPACKGCMEVYKARAGLTVAGLVQWGDR